ncbi:MAG: hypothetical protein L0177_19335 [Chloroflexi bacterium]|nr:hypothetical protein [Chloroflexota bacterium]
MTQQNGNLGRLIEQAIRGRPRQEDPLGEQPNWPPRLVPLDPPPNLTVDANVQQLPDMPGATHLRIFVLDAPIRAWTGNRTPSSTSGGQWEDGTIIEWLEPTLDYRPWIANFRFTRATATNAILAIEPFQLQTRP